MKWLEGLVVVSAMLLPFVAIKSEDLTTYVYWILVSAAYLTYTAVRWRK
jgi:hypothetical protein